MANITLNGTAYRRPLAWTFDHGAKNDLTSVPSLCTLYDR